MTSRSEGLAPAFRCTGRSSFPRNPAGFREAVIDYMDYLLGMVSRVFPELEKRVL